MIVTMKKISVIGLLREQAAVTDVLQRFGRVQVVGEQHESPKLAQLVHRNEQREKIAHCIDFLSKYQTQSRGLLASLDVVLRELPEEEAERLSADEDKLRQAFGQVENYEHRLSEIAARRTSLNALRQQLTPWEAIDIPLEEITDTRLTRSFPGYVLSRDAIAFENDMNECDGLCYVQAGGMADSTCYLVTVYKEDAETAEQIFRRNNFTKVEFSGVRGTAQEAVGRVQDESDALTAEEASITDEIGGSGLLRYFENMSDVFAVGADSLAAQTFTNDTETCFELEGWIPAEDCDEAVRRMEAVTQSLIVEFEDVGADEEPPVLVRNNKAVGAFESITDAFSHPAYRDIDPNAMLLVFYSLFFGMMVADAGYGILVSLACGAVLAFLHPKPGMRKLLGVFLMGGLAATVVGVIFGSYFGASLLPALLPVESATGMPLQLEIPLEMMIVSIGLGIVHMFSGYIAKAVRNIREGDVFAAIFDQGFWMLFVIGLLMLVGPMAVEGETGALIGRIGTWVAIGSALVLIATQGRHAKGLFGKLGGGLGSLYNITSFLGDALSYTRLFALGLSSSIIAWVFNMMSTLAGTDTVVGVIFMVIILAIGHALNLALGLLSAYVHTSRLQYVEFFGKFFDGNGDEFTPLSRKTQYVTLTQGK